MIKKTEKLVIKRHKNYYEIIEKNPRKPIVIVTSTYKKGEDGK